MYSILCVALCALCVTSVQSVNSISPKSNHLINKTANGAETDLLNKAKLSLASEGGTLSPNTLDISLPKENFTSLMSLEAESVKTKEKPVVPRKGVDNLLADSNTEVNSSQSKIVDTVTQQPQNLNNTTKSSSVVSVISTNRKQNDSSTISTKPPIGLKKTNNTAIHKKPQILSYEALATVEKNIQNDKSKGLVAPSTITLASNQIPSPNEDSKVKVYPTKANSHPGMIMPIVITILVVPMFAIVGYMAIKRGQEAWKNRHYKRMDFLLDGMYND